MEKGRKGKEEEQDNITDNTYRTLYTSTFPIPTHTAKQIPPTGLRGGRERERQRQRDRERQRERERQRGSYNDIHNITASTVTQTHNRTLTIVAINSSYNLTISVKVKYI